MHSFDQGCFPPTPFVYQGRYRHHSHDKWTRPSPFVFAYYKRSKTGQQEGLGTRLGSNSGSHIVSIELTHPVDTILPSDQYKQEWYKMWCWLSYRLQYTCLVSPPPGTGTPTKEQSSTCLIHLYTAHLMKVYLLRTYCEKQAPSLRVQTPGNNERKSTTTYMSAI